MYPRQILGGLETEKKTLYLVDIKYVKNILICEKNDT